MKRPKRDAWLCWSLPRGRSTRGPLVSQEKSLTRPWLSCRVGAGFIFKDNLFWISKFKCIWQNVYDKCIWQNCHIHCLRLVDVWSWAEAYSESLTFLICTVNRSLHQPLPRPGTPNLNVLRTGCHLGGWWMALPRLQGLNLPPFLGCECQLEKHSHNGKMLAAAYTFL